MGKIITAIDIGTSKVYTLIAEIPNGEEAVSVLGFGVSRSSGIKQGVVVNSDNVVKSIEESVSIAAGMVSQNTGVFNIGEVYVSISDAYIESITKSSAIQLADNPREVQEYDKAELEYNIEKKYVIPGKALLHKSVYNYKVDGSGILKDPIGREGLKLEATVHLVLGREKNVDIMEQVLAKAGIRPKGMIFKPIATSVAVLSEEERKSGIILVDIGAGTTTVSIFKNGRIIYSGAIPVGGDTFSNDLAEILDMEKKEAEGLKRDMAMITGEISKDEKIEIETKTEKKDVKISFVKEILDDRSEELMKLIEQKLIESKFGDVAINGIALCGGAVKTSGLIDRARRHFNMPVKVAVVNKVKGFGDMLYKPEGATGAGILIYAIQNIESTENIIEESEKKKKKNKNKTSTNNGPSFIERVWTGMKRFVFDID
jgi:cell division protein FtsA